MKIKKFKKMKKIKVKKNSVTNFENCVIKILLAISIITFILIILLEKFNDNDSDKVNLFQNIFIGLMGSAIVSYVTLLIPFIIKNKKQYEKIRNMILSISFKFKFIYYSATHYDGYEYINEDMNECINDFFRSVNDLNYEILNSDFTFLSLEESIKFINENIIATVKLIGCLIKKTEQSINEKKVLRTEINANCTKINNLIKETIDKKISIKDFDSIIYSISDNSDLYREVLKNEDQILTKKMQLKYDNHTIMTVSELFRFDLYKILQDIKKAED